LSSNSLGPTELDETYTTHQSTLCTESSLAKVIDQKNKNKELKFKLRSDFKLELEFEFYAPHQATLGIESSSMKVVNQKQTKKKIPSSSSGFTRPVELFFVSRLAQRHLHTHQNT
jgi:hypothetical protein